MNTKILSEQSLDEAVRLLKKGEVIAIPTETVYGLAADATQIEAINKIFAIKKRPANHPLILHLGDIGQLEVWADNIPPLAVQLAQSFWPGPLTLVLNKRPSVTGKITGNQSTIALRIPKHPLTLALLKKLGTGIVAPSANKHKKTSPTSPAHVLKGLSGEIPAILDGGPCELGIESTILDLTQDRPIILRPGTISAKEIEAVLGYPIEMNVPSDKKVPGNMAVHYQPDKPLYLLTKRAIERELLPGMLTAIIHYSELTYKKGPLYIKMPSDRAGYAKKIYQTLHTIDESPVDKVWVEQPPNTSEWDDVNDRLTKAAYKP